MTNVIFRLEKKSDSDCVEVLIKQCFPKSSEKRAVSILRKTKSWKSEYCFVAEDEGIIIGSIRFSNVVLPSGSKTVMLGPLSVAEKYRGKGVGQTLVENALHILAGHQDGVLVVGNEEYYEAYGFETYVVENLRLKGEINPLSLMGLEFEDDFFYNEKGFVSGV